MVLVSKHVNNSLKYGFTFSANFKTNAICWK